ncbi:MAG: 3-deoxy-manno-octulosonate cytidylyltransferase [Alphaproteobacteria bacterium]|jgi:3-deoxy-manno-octulosonate cytidylyltransferase (CMP-KDO synthetase)|nr:3-deoxy-manno-octulosonate cytidylyltransferase [Alphaproteobacteria bacterium]
MSKTIVFIPSRLASTRCPNKPLADINGKSMILRIYENVKNMTDYDVCVAAGDPEIVEEIVKNGGEAILTDPTLPSGSDRIYAALQKIDPDGTKYDRAVSFQGDAINVNPNAITALVELQEKTGADVTTPVKIMDEKDYYQPNFVKVAAGFKEGEDEARALYFSRSLIPFDRDADNKREIYDHVGIYVYKVESLKKFISSPVGILEKREMLEQLRVMELGMSIYVKLLKEIKLIKEAPADVDTPEELELCRKYIK